MENSKVKEICFLGLLIALVCTGTMFLNLPVPATEGYIHFGDGFIILISVLFGRKYGTIAGGVGSALADMLLGYSHWILFTLIIKGFMGFVAGTISDYKNENSKFFSVRNIISAFSAEVIMIFGYFVFGALLKGFFMTPSEDISMFSSQFEYGVIQALFSIPENAIQGIGGIIIFDIIGCALHNAKIVKLVKQK